MKLIVLGSSSKGNCYILDNDSEALVIEAGVRFSEVQKGLGYNVTKVVGCLVSHEHGDHAAYVEDFLRMRIPVYSTKNVRAKFSYCSLMHDCIEAKTFQVGGFSVCAVPVEHDVPCLAFIIYHNDMGKLLFATDTAYIKFRVPGLSNIMIEANYEQGIINRNVEKGIVDKNQRDRVILNHMSIDTCIETLLANDLTKVNNIVLLHLSNDNSSASRFIQMASEKAGKAVQIAKKGLTINNFGRTPF